MTENNKHWVAVENNIVVHSGFQAPQSYVDNYTELVVDREDRQTPPWYNANVRFVDVTDLNPRPVTGWYKTPTGWADGNPKLEANKLSIPADGATTSTVTFSQVGPKTPAKIKFNVNNQEVEETLVNGVATVDVTSTNPGDLVVVSAVDLSVTITVEG